MKKSGRPAWKEAEMKQARPVKEILKMIEVAKLSLAPGDILVIRSDEALRAITESAETLKHFEPDIPD